MSHSRLFVGRVLAIAWRGPEDSDLDAVGRDLGNEHRRQQQRLLYLSIIGEGNIPSGEIRDKMVEFYDMLLTHCDSLHICISGPNFEQSIKRSVITGVLLKIPARGRVFIDGSVNGVIAASPMNVRAELERAALEASAQKVFDFAESGGPIRESWKPIA